MIFSQKICTSLHHNEVSSGNFITINNNDENTKIRNHIENLRNNSLATYNSFAFIGLRKGCLECDYYWEDYTKPNYTNWHDKQPDNANNDCALINSTDNSGRWYDSSCGYLGDKNGVCQFYMNKKPGAPKPVLPPKGGCKSNWWAFGGYCYAYNAEMKGQILFCKLRRIS